MTLDPISTWRPTWKPAAAAIRARWASVEWHYAEEGDDTFLHANTPDETILIVQASSGERATLQRAAHAPADIRDLLAALDAALALLKQCKPWIPYVERELRDALEHVLEESSIPVRTCDRCHTPLDNVTTGVSIVTDGYKRLTVCGNCRVVLGWAEVARER